MDLVVNTLSGVAPGVEMNSDLCDLLSLGVLVAQWWSCFSGRQGEAKLLGRNPARQLWPETLTRRRVNFQRYLPVSFAKDLAGLTSVRHSDEGPQKCFNFFEFQSRTNKMNF